MSEALDQWLPYPVVRTRHQRVAEAEPGELWEIARRIRLEETRRLGKLVGWRIPGVNGQQTYHELFRAYPFCVLEESASSLVSGLCGRIWTLARDYPALEEWNSQSKRGEVTAVIGNRFIVHGTGSDVSSLEPVRKAVEAVNFSQVAALK